MDSEESITDGEPSPAGPVNFKGHFNHTLSNAAASTLQTKSRKFNRTLPPFPNSRFQWIGTKEISLDENLPAASEHIKMQLLSYWIELFSSRNSKGADFDFNFDSSERGFFLSLCSRYYDILHYNKRAFYLSDKFDGDDASLMDAYLMHSLNHVLKSTDLIVKNDNKLAKLRRDTLTDSRFCDRGFTQPKVLILLPFKSFTFRVVKRLIQLVPKDMRVEVLNLQQFCREYEPTESDEKRVRLGKRYKRGCSGFESKSTDLCALLKENKEQHFAMGIKFMKKNVELFSDFYSSDIIVASPLGLLSCAANTDQEKVVDYDYLSSIEVLIIDNADVMTVQNWEHVKSVVGELNKMPDSSRGTDVMRIREWYFDGLSRYYRQSIVLGSHLTPEMNDLFNQQCVNFQGKVKLEVKYPGVVSNVLSQVAQLFQRFDADSVISVNAARLKFFVEKIYPKIRDSEHGGVMIFIRTHLELVGVSKYLKQQDASFCVIDDETKESADEVSRARQEFLDEKHKIMLYTERAHFYRRYQIRGIKHLIMFNPPETTDIYLEMVNMVERSNEMTMEVLFCKFDVFQLQRIVGSDDTELMLSSDNKTSPYC